MPGPPGRDVSPAELLVDHFAAEGSPPITPETGRARPAGARGSRQAVAEQGARLDAHTISFLLIRGRDPGLSYSVTF